MVTGPVNAVLEGNILLLIEDVAGKRHDVEATVDTGFTGFLSLPRSRILTLGLVYRYHDFALLGDGTTILIHLYEATVIWDGQAKIVTVIESDVFPLVGMSMLAGYRLRMDVVDGGAIEIEPLP